MSAAFERGDRVRIITGPRIGFQSTVDYVKRDQERVALIVPVFGRQTRIEFEQSPVERL